MQIKLNSVNASLPTSPVTATQKAETAEAVEKKPQLNLADLLKKPLSKPEVKSLNQILADDNKAKLPDLQKPETESLPASENVIPEVTAQKYQIVANASDYLSDEVIADFTEHMQSILDSFSSMDIGHAMERVIVYAQAHPELEAILRPEDLQIFVRGARASYAKVLAAKTERKTKTSKRAEKLAVTVNDLNEVFASLEINL